VNPSATVFAIDTAGDGCVLALAHPGGIDVMHAERGHTHLENVMPLVDALFARCGLRPGQCDAFAFASGPGSFTGLRVACTMVQGLALGTGKPVIALDHLSCLMAAAAPAAGALPLPPADERRALVVIDARMDQFYWASYACTGGAGEWRLREAPALEDAARMAERVRESGVQCCVGDAGFIRSSLAAGAGGAPDIAVLDASIDGALLARLARARFAAGATIAPQEAYPQYVRDQVAQTVAQRQALQRARAQ